MGTLHDMAPYQSRRKDSDVESGVLLADTLFRGVHFSISYMYVENMMICPLLHINDEKWSVMLVLCICIYCNSSSILAFDTVLK